MATKREIIRGYFGSITASLNADNGDQLVRDIIKKGNDRIKLKDLDGSALDDNITTAIATQLIDAVNARNEAQTISIPTLAEFQAEIAAADPEPTNE